MILGTARNLTTRIGMIEQIQWLKKVRKSIDFQVDIAGYGTEAIKNYCDLEDFMVHGSVQPNQLNTLLTNTKAVIVHQKAGAGALTRIPEMLIAGIPVIANNNACRSAFDYSGVYCYDDWTELAEIMKKELTIPELLSRPFAAEKRFINCLSELLDCNNFENN